MKKSIEALVSNSVPFRYLLRLPIAASSNEYSGLEIFRPQIDTFRILLDLACSLYETKFEVDDIVLRNLMTNCEQLMDCYSCASVIPSVDDKIYHFCLVSQSFSGVIRGGLTTKEIDDFISWYRSHEVLPIPSKRVYDFFSRLEDLKVSISLEQLITLLNVVESHWRAFFTDANLSNHGLSIVYLSDLLFSVGNLLYSIRINDRHHTPMTLDWNRANTYLVAAVMRASIGFCAGCGAPGAKLTCPKCGIPRLCGKDCWKKNYTSSHRYFCGLFSSNIIDTRSLQTPPWMAPIRPEFLRIFRRVHLNDYLKRYYNFSGEGCIYLLPDPNKEGSI